ncbi:hypothetical protein EJ08DRAFT_654918 [Tothia fuscella]|uniref:Uncharacterized protein n=1 Tax=Tothia fuscella TaxID=1048955 RepID=A0A9P4P1W9_9PEZI|nr:hypothetical protein EJ08DRAFT_654918 [Tothia fuscella]
MAPVQPSMAPIVTLMENLENEVKDLDESISTSLNMINGKKRKLGARGGRVELRQYKAAVTRAKRKLAETQADLKRAEEQEPILKAQAAELVDEIAVDAVGLADSRRLKNEKQQLLGCLQHLQSRNQIATSSEAEVELQSQANTNHTSDCSEMFSSSKLHIPDSMSEVGCTQYVCCRPARHCGNQRVHSTETQRES